MRVTQIEWFKVAEKLPEIEEGKHGISVLMATEDPVYQEVHPSDYYEIFDGMYCKINDEDREQYYKDSDKECDFMTLYVGADYSDYGPVYDDIHYWAYMPKLTLDEE